MRGDGELETEAHKNINLLDLESSKLELLDDPVKRDGRVGSGEDVPGKKRGEREVSGRSTSEEVFSTRKIRG